MNEMDKNENARIDKEWAFELMKTMEIGISRARAERKNDITIVMNYDTLRRMEKVFQQKHWLFWTSYCKPEICGVPIEINDAVEDGCAYLIARTTEFGFIPPPELMGKDLFGEEYGED